MPIYRYIPVSLSYMLGFYQPKSGIYKIHILCYYQQRFGLYAQFSDFSFNFNNIFLWTFVPCRILIKACLRQVFYDLKK